VRPDTSPPADSHLDAVLPPGRRAGLDARAVAWLQRLLTRGEHASGAGVPHGGKTAEPAVEKETIKSH
jgi:hypothetical protein